MKKGMRFQQEALVKSVCKSLQKRCTHSAYQKTARKSSSASHSVAIRQKKRSTDSLKRSSTVCATILLACRNRRSFIHDETKIRRCRTKKKARTIVTGSDDTASWTSARRTDRSEPTSDRR